MFDTKRKELNVQGLACTFSLPNVDAYFLVNDELVLYKSKVVASGVMYRILGENTDIVVFVDTIPYIEHNAMSYDEVVHVEFENLDYKEVEILSYKACVVEEEDGYYTKRTYLVDYLGLSSGVLRIEILSHSNEFDSLVSAIVKEIQVKTIEEW
ncbi:hypothetical protein KSW27_00750 [Holdemanella biformis]|uniref:hypothetical protein n=1 Tax=Holdemanella biformis TaxID=1735 RepID=UPI001C2632AD|nr:hypothetical protein [Holdemanella biformis]MBU9894783.1 hypothetical protein [Holdemanella biformis]MBV3415824.1 hypothetical protein [Holdemanella biformis]